MGQAIVRGPARPADRRPVIVTSQLPVADWHRQLKNPSFADAILDRLVHGATRFELRAALSSHRSRASEQPDRLCHRMVRARRSDS